MVLKIVFNRVAAISYGEDPMMRWSFHIAHFSRGSHVISKERRTLCVGYLNKYTDIFESATFSFWRQKFPRPHSRIQIEYARPHVSWYFWMRNFFFARTVLNTHGKELDSILWRLKEYPDLASTRFRVHSGFKNFQSGVRIQKVEDSYAGFTGSVWTVAVSRRKKLGDSKISGYVWTGPNLSCVLRNHWTSRSLS